MQNNQYWRQDDPRLNERQAWPKEAFPEADYAWFRESGCLVCSLAAMLLRFGLEKNTEEEPFNPWILNQRLIACGAFTPEADLELDDIWKLYPLRYIGSIPYSWDTLKQLIENGSLCLVTVPGIRGPRHFTAVLCLTEDDAVLFDPLCGERKLREVDRLCEIREFRLKDKGR